MARHEGEGGERNDDRKPIGWQQTDETPRGEAGEIGTFRSEAKRENEAAEDEEQDDGGTTEYEGTGARNEGARSRQRRQRQKCMMEDDDKGRDPTQRIEMRQTFSNRAR